MPPKQDINTQKPMIKKAGKGKNQAFELDSTPPTAGEGIFENKQTHTKYEGQWQRFDGVMKRHGMGIYTDGGATYDGHFTEDQYDGFGVYTAIDGSSYKGDWKNGLMHGHGIYTWPDGAVFDGKWENGKMEGPGTFTDAQKHIWIGEWHDGNANCMNQPIS